MLPDMLTPFRPFTASSQEARGTIRSSGLPFYCRKVNFIQMRMKYLQSDPVKNISKRLLASMSHWKPSAKSTSALTASAPEQSYKHIAARTYMPQSPGKAGLYSHRRCLQQQLNVNWCAECPERKWEGERMSVGLSACYLGSLMCPLKLSRQVPEVEASPDYSPIIHLPHHCDPPSQPWGRGTRGDTSQRTQR